MIGSFQYPTVLQKQSQPNCNVLSILEERKTRRQKDRREKEERKERGWDGMGWRLGLGQFLR
jgi:hypothetical protein